MSVDVSSQQDKMRKVLNHGAARLPPPPAAADGAAVSNGSSSNKSQCLEPATQREKTTSGGTSSRGARDEGSSAEAHALQPHKPLARLLHKFAPQVRLYIIVQI